MIGSLFTAYFIIFQCLVKIPSGKIPSLTNNWLLITDSIFRRLKGKIKNDDIDWLQKFSSGLKLSLFIPYKNW